MNIPSNDAGLVMLPGAEPFCEWLVSLNGQIATCVESAEMMVDNLVTRGAIPVSAAEDTALAQDLISRNQASANGATDYMAASQQMTRLGIPNTAYGSDWFASNDFVPVVQDAIKRGIPVLFGLYAAYLLHDDWTNQDEDANVDGHGITIFGMDSTGAICADPNTVQARDGNFVHYTWDDLRRAGGSYPSMVIPNQGASMVPTGWKDDGTTLTAPNGVVVVRGFRDFVLNHLWDNDDYPLAPEQYVGQVEEASNFGEGARQEFRKHLLCWIKNPPAGAPQGCYAAWVGLNLSAVEAQLAEANKEIAALKAAQNTGPSVPADTHSTLATLVNVLGPIADSVVATRNLMKELGY